MITCPEQVGICVRSTTPSSLRYDEDRKLVKRINDLISGVVRNGYEGDRQA